MCRVHISNFEQCGQGSSSQSPNAGKLSLLELPAEIHLSILSHADYYDLQALRQTNQYLRSIIELRRRRRALKQLERRPLYKGQYSVAGNKFPCYDCLQLLNSAQCFPMSMTMGDYRFCGQFSYNRRCMTCAHTGKSVFISPVESEHFYFEEACWIDCRLCRTTRHCQKLAENKDGTTHRCSVCDVCYKQQQEIWPALAASEQTENPEAKKIKRTLSLFRRKTVADIMVSEVTPEATKGFLKPTKSFLSKARTKFRQSVAKRGGKEVSGTRKTALTLRLVSRKGNKVAE